MAQGDDKTPQGGDNPNKPSVGPNKGNLEAGDIHWVTLPENMEEGDDGSLKPKDRVNGGKGEGATKGLSKGQKRDLASRIRAKLSRKG